MGGYGCVGNGGVLCSTGGGVGILVRVVAILVNSQGILGVKCLSTLITRARNVDVKFDMGPHIAQMITLSVTNCASPYKFVCLFLSVFQDQAADLLIEVSLNWVC